MSAPGETEKHLMDLSGVSRQRAMHVHALTCAVLHQRFDSARGKVHTSVQPTASAPGEKRGYGREPSGDQALARVIDSSVSATHQLNQGLTRQSFVHLQPNTGTSSKENLYFELDQESYRFLRSRRCLSIEPCVYTIRICDLRGILGSVEVT